MDLISPLGGWNFQANFPNFFMRSFMYGMVGSLAMFISSWDKTDRMRDQYLDKNRNYGDTYDFIVVGGGTTGGIIAYRLSQHYKVLLLEAGSEPHPFQSIPLMTNFMTNYPELDWSHSTVPQKHAFYGTPGNRARISGGKSLGGSSNLDYMMYLRGSPHDYDNWAKITGDTRWSYDKLIKYFKRTEAYHGAWNKSKMHGSSGEMNIETNPMDKDLGNRFISAGNEMGYPHTDLNGLYAEGFDLSAHPMSKGHRHMAYKSYLKRHAHFKWHLVLHKYAHVNKILTRGESNEAYAVSYDRHGESRIAYARKEIILSAGAINSPKILMHSGIGPSGHLQDVGIPAKVHLPQVGANLQDHVGLYLGPFFTKKRRDTSILIDRDVNSAALFQFTMGQGPLTSTGYIASGMMSSSHERIHGNPSWPDLQLTLYNMALHSSAPADISHKTGLDKSILSKYYAPHTRDRDSFHVLITATRPKSRGQITLRDNNPYSPPLIDPKYLNEISDVGLLVDGIKKTLRLVEGSIHLGGQLGAHFTNDSVEECSQWKFRSEEYWSCFARLMTVSVGNIGGSVGLGAALDSEFRVKGTERLRVIDASVMPQLTSCSLSGPTMMIGEMGVELILNLWGQAHKADKFNKDRSHIKGILKGANDLIRGMDAKNIFMEGLKGTQSFKELSPDDLKKAMESSRGEIFNVLGGRGLSTEKDKKMNPFKLVGTMFKNSFTRGNSNTDDTGNEDNGNQQWGSLNTNVVPVISSLQPPPLPHYPSSSDSGDVPIDALFAPTTTPSPFAPPPPGYITYPLNEIWLTKNSAKSPSYVLEPKPLLSSSSNSLRILRDQNSNLQSHVAKFMGSSNNRQVRHENISRHQQIFKSVVNSSPMRFLFPLPLSFIPMPMSSTPIKPTFTSLQFQAPNGLHSAISGILNSPQAQRHVSATERIISTTTPKTIQEDFHSLISKLRINTQQVPSYESQMSQDNNTFKHPNPNPIPSEVHSPSLATSKYIMVENDSSSGKDKIPSENYEILFHESGKQKSDKFHDFSSNVEELFRQQEGRGFEPHLPQGISTSSVDPAPLAHYALLDTKSLNEEVDKILMRNQHQQLNLTPQIIHKQEQRLIRGGQGKLLQSDRVPFSKIIHRILEKEAKRNGIHSFPAPAVVSFEGPSVREGNLKSPIQIPWPPALLRNKIPKTREQQKQNMSFSIKILNQ